MMDKIILRSSRALPSCDNYAIGSYQDGELYLTPLKGILQLRPEFNYLDRADKRGKDDGKNAADGKKFSTSFEISLCILLLYKMWIDSFLYCRS